MFSLPLTSLGSSTVTLKLVVDWTQFFKTTKQIQTLRLAGSSRRTFESCSVGEQVKSG